MPLRSLHRLLSCFGLLWTRTRLWRRLHQRVRRVALCPGFLQIGLRGAALEPRPRRPSTLACPGLVGGVGVGVGVTGRGLLRRNRWLRVSHGHRSPSSLPIRRVRWYLSGWYHEAGLVSRGIVTLDELASIHFIIRANRRLSNLIRHHLGVLGVSLFLGRVDERSTHFRLRASTQR